MAYRSLSHGGYQDLPKIEVGIQLLRRIFGELEQFAQLLAGTREVLDRRFGAQACIAFRTLDIIASSTA